MIFGDSYEAKIVYETTQQVVLSLPIWVGNVEPKTRQTLIFFYSIQNNWPKSSFSQLFKKKFAFADFEHVTCLFCKSNAPCEI